MPILSIKYMIDKIMTSKIINILYITDLVITNESSKTFIKQF